MVEEKPAKVLLGEIVARHYKEAWEAKNNGELVGWCASNFPQEIFETMDIKVVYPENQAAAISAKGGGQMTSVLMLEYLWHTWTLRMLQS